MTIPINKQGGRATYYYPSLVQSIGDTFVCEADQFGERQAFKNESFSEQKRAELSWPGPAQLPQSMFEDQRKLNPASKSNKHSRPAKLSEYSVQA